MSYAMPYMSVAVYSVIVSMMTKFHNDKLSLVQRILFMFLYGSSVH